MQSQRQSRSRVLEALPTVIASASHSLLPTLPDANDTVSLAVSYFPTRLNNRLFLGLFVTPTQVNQCKGESRVETHALQCSEFAHAARTLKFQSISAGKCLALGLREDVVAILHKRKNLVALQVAMAI